MHTLVYVLSVLGDFDRIHNILEHLIVALQIYMSYHVRLDNDSFKSGTVLKLNRIM